MESNASDAVQTLEEMAFLTHELLTSDPSSDSSTCASACFTGAVAHKLPDSFPDQPLNQIIKCLRLAKMHKPEMREVPFLLVKCLLIRYDSTMNDELDEAASILDEMISSSSPGDEFVAKCQAMVPELAMLRSLVDNNMEYSEEAIYRARAFLASSSDEEPLYPTWSKVLDHAAKNRFEIFGPIGGFEAPSVLANDSEITRETHPFDRLLNGIRNNDINDIDEGIELGRTILASPDPSDLDAQLAFGDILFEAFERTNKKGYLNKSITTHRQILARPLPKLLRFSVIARLFDSLLTRSEVSPGHHTQDLRDVVQLHSQFLNDGSGWLSPLNQFQLACNWAFFAQAIRHPSVFTAYETAFSLMQDAFLLAPTLQQQHATLAALPAHAHAMPLGFASYLVELCLLEQAIETLEQGRALLWSEMRHLRASIYQLLEADPELGHNFAALNRDLEELTKSIPPSHELNLDDVIADDLRAGDEFGSFLLSTDSLIISFCLIIVKRR
jgi:hypothetical protein